MRTSVKILFVFLFGAIAFNLGAVDKAKSERLIASLEKQLATASTSADSLKIYYDIFDLSQFSTRVPVAEKAYQTAKRANDIAAQFDLLRLLSNRAYRNDSLFEHYINLAKKLPDGNERTETLTFIRLSRILNDVRDTETRSEILSRKIIDSLMVDYRQYGNEVHDVYREFETVFSICIYLQISVPGKMLSDKLVELERLLAKLPGEHTSLTSLFYNFVINAYIASGDQTTALRMTQEFLDFVDKLEKSYHDKGRIYRSYDSYRYSIYRRALSCYEVLPVEKVDSIYSIIETIALRDPDVKSDMINAKRPDIYRMMAHHKYREAVAAIQSVLPGPRDNILREALLKQYVLAARGAGDKDAMRDALDRYIKMLEERAGNNLLSASLELQQLHNNSTLYETTYRLKMENLKLAEDLTSRRIMHLMIGGILFIITIIIFYIAYRRARSMSSRLKETNKDLMRERDALKNAHKAVLLARDKANVADRKKTDFVHDISHEIAEPTNAIVGYSQLIVDSVDDNRRALLDKFVDEIKSAAEKLLKLVNDVLDSNMPDASGNPQDENSIQFNLSDMMDKILFNNSSKVAGGFTPDLFNNTPEQNMNIIGNKGIIEQTADSLFKLVASYCAPRSMVAGFGFDAKAGTGQVVYEFLPQGTTNFPGGKSLVKAIEDEIVSIMRTYINRLKAKAESVAGDIVFHRDESGKIRIEFTFLCAPSSFAIS